MRRTDLFNELEWENVPPDLIKPTKIAMELAEISSVDGSDDAFDGKEMVEVWLGAGALCGDFLRESRKGNDPSIEILMMIGMIMITCGMFEKMDAIQQLFFRKQMAKMERETGVKAERLLSRGGDSWPTK